MERVQKMYQLFQEEMNWNSNAKRNDFQHSKEFRSLIYKAEQLKQNGISADEAYIIAKADIRENLRKELADCLAYLCKVANFFELNLETELRKKLDEVRDRKTFNKK